MTNELRTFVDAGPPLQREVLRMLVSLARRPRGAQLLRRLPLAEQAVGGVMAMARYDDPARAAALGWDAERVAARGRELRRAEGRP